MTDDVTHIQTPLTRAQQRVDDLNRTINAGKGSLSEAELLELLEAQFALHDLLPDPQTLMRANTANVILRYLVRTIQALRAERDVDVKDPAEARIKYDEYDKALNMALEFIVRTGGDA